MTGWLDSLLKRIKKKFKIIIFVIISICFAVGCAIIINITNNFIYGLAAMICYIFILGVLSKYLNIFGCDRHEELTLSPLDRVCIEQTDVFCEGPPSYQVAQQTPPLYDPEQCQPPSSIQSPVNNIYNTQAYEDSIANNSREAPSMRQLR
ncbi:hypothetical protein CONCODRAFT_8174 [Conidiobolus coronatus NRRL 28638]|uniref:Uncharacterized protein n=1 Tax=Conidiobolus coronatus (strain ATCC 28846 / CBS 209.66 / NRRL 28638) TaxID=796925 RepID=A0A137P329_CONC2|nr:hypothetical protein CONCODRAFT_8174 [Conidiobolus coronatus NRRL 28638]|eukprot:KXN69436.1 hypothetical protein CONCODRAFT_8174 [Conidiobolus coronatus NRRL 28638]